MKQKPTSTEPIIDSTAILSTLVALKDITIDGYLTDKAHHILIISCNLTLTITVHTVGSSELSGGRPQRPATLSTESNIGAVPALFTSSCMSPSFVLMHSTPKRMTKKVISAGLQVVNSIGEITLLVEVGMTIVIAKRRRIRRI